MASTKHKLIKDFQLITDDKKIIILKSGTMIIDYYYKTKDSSIKIDEAIVNSNDLFFEKIDWKTDLNTYLKSNKVAQPGIVAKKLIPFIEENFIQTESDSTDWKFKIKEIESEYKSKEKELKEDIKEREQSLRKYENDFLDRIAKIDTRSEELEKKYQDKESDLIQKYNDKIKSLTEEYEERIKFLEGKGNDLDKKLKQREKEMSSAVKELEKRESDLVKKIEELEKRESSLNKKIKLNDGEIAVLKSDLDMILLLSSFSNKSVLEKYGYEYKDGVYVRS